jgi:hypothetical protein
MATQAQYASIPKVGNVSITTANAARDGTGALGILFTATPTNASGSRIDRIQIDASATVTAGMVRFFITQGRQGTPISTITFVTTTATVTTTVNHGLTTGDLVTIQGVIPDQYNVSGVAITVTGLTTFTYTMATAPTVAASTVGGFATTPAVPVTKMWREVNVTAAVPSATAQAFSSTMSSLSGADIGYLPLILPTGWSLRVSTNNGEPFNVFANGGDLA